MGFGLVPLHPAEAPRVRMEMTSGKKRMQQYVTVLLIGLLALEASALTPREGPVRADGHAVADAKGAFNALGATLFWGAWGYKFDRPRLERNFGVLRAAGVDYVRVLGSVGGTGWEDRQTDPRWSDYDAIIAGMTDLAYDRYGLRVQWTLFGGAPFTPAGPAREALVDRFAALARGREHKLFAFEIANEAWQNGFPGPEGTSELRLLGARLAERTPVLVALSAPSTGEACATYAGAGADAITIHYPRGSGAEDPAAPLQRPWTFPGAYDAKCRGQLPPLVFNNEPIGPEASVQQDDSASRIAAGYVMTFLAGNASYVLHAGPGIRGGGKADIEGPLRRHANYDELPSLKAIAAALTAAKQYLPAGVANWTRHEPDSTAAPLHGFRSLYSASSGTEFVAVALGVEKNATVRANRAAFLELRDMASGRVLKRVNVKVGQKLPISGATEIVIIGRNT